MQINDLKIFQAVAEHSSFTKAAAVTNTVQSNVTARIKYLEEYFDTRLFERTSRKIELTDAGSHLLKVAKEIRLLLENTKATLGGNNTVADLIKIGCVHTTAALRAPGILKNFSDKYPQVEFRLKTGTSADLVKDVLSYKLDGAFVAGKVSNRELIVQPVLVEELGIITSSLITSIDQLKKTVKPLKLVVFNDGCSYRKHFEALLGKWHISRFAVAEMDTLEGIINTVEAGIGVTLLPVALIEKHYRYRNLHTFHLPKNFARVQTVFIRRKDLPVNKGYQLFFEMIGKGYTGS
jgi:DNA-binding transcriptional LysR family regulator